MHNTNDELNRVVPVVKVYAWWLGLSFGLVLFSYLGAISWLSNPLSRTVVGAYSLTQQGLWAMKAPFTWVSYWQSGTQRIADLEERLARMAAARSELEKYRDQEQLIEPAGFSGLLRVRLIQGKDRSLIASGQSSGVSVGDVIVSSEGGLWGRVTNINKYTSAVIRPSHWNSRVAVRVVGKATNGVVSGDGVNASLVGVLQSDNLEVGDVLVTSGADELYPEGVVVGEVAAILGEAAEVTKEATVKMFNTYNNWGFILK